MPVEEAIVITQPTDSTIPPLTKPEVVEIVKDNLPGAVEQTKLYTWTLTIVGGSVMDGKGIVFVSTAQPIQRGEPTSVLNTWLKGNGFVNPTRFPCVGQIFYKTGYIYHVDGILGNTTNANRITVRLTKVDITNQTTVGYTEDVAVSSSTISTYKEI